MRFAPPPLPLWLPLRSLGLGLGVGLIGLVVARLMRSMFALVASIIARTSAVLGRARSAADANSPPGVPTEVPTIPPPTAVPGRRACDVLEYAAV